MKKLKGNEGITLIALVITIIVTMILAVITITTTVGDGGLIKRAREAVANLEGEAQASDEMIDSVVGKIAQKPDDEDMKDPDIDIDIQKPTDLEGSNNDPRIIRNEPSATQGYFMVYIIGEDDDVNDKLTYTVFISKHKNGSFKEFKKKKDIPSGTEEELKDELEDGTWYYYITISDGKATVSSKTEEVLISRIDEKPTYTLTPATWTNGDVILTLGQHSDTSRDIKTKYQPISGTEMLSERLGSWWQQYNASSKPVITENKTVYTRYEYGINYGPYQEIQIKNIDKQTK